MPWPPKSNRRSASLWTVRTRLREVCRVHPCEYKGDSPSSRPSAFTVRSFILVFVPQRHGIFKHLTRVQEKASETLIHYSGEDVLKKLRIALREQTTRKLYAPMPCFVVCLLLGLCFFFLLTALARLGLCAYVARKYSRVGKPAAEARQAHESSRSARRAPLHGVARRDDRNIRSIYTRSHCQSRRVTGDVDLRCHGRSGSLTRIKETELLHCF